MEELIWKTIPGFTGYQASNTGLLKSLNYKKSNKEQVLKPAINPNGYPQTMLKSDDGVYKSKPVHYFVALAFFGVRPENFDVNHIDGFKTNNNILN